ncbi:DUF1501 domain-containing protein [Novipirellula sp. SH528]|uniref:DUF1501 domain-containing protein n=1 Tax=Novipirellula sp. SH528 TaxID=3454466 RepID=UPI003F9FA114
MDQSRSDDLFCPGCSKGLKKNHSDNILAVDQPIDGFLEDLEWHGFLDEKLVVIASELGRTPD